MRLAFVCDTPYQVLTATNLYLTMFYKKKTLADLYIVNQFKDAEIIYENIKEENLFDNVFFLKKEENRFMPKGIKRYIKVAYSYLSTKHAIENQMKLGEVISVIDRYDVIFAAVMTCFVSALVKLNRNAEFALFDDGLGSYFGDIVYLGGGTMYRMFSKVTRTGVYAARAEKLYVNNKEMCQSTAADIIIQIPKMSDEFLKIADKIFSIQGKIDESKKIIFLSQPSTGKNEIEADMQKLIDILADYKEHTIVRLHPRETKVEKYKNFELDKAEEFWELKISKMDMSEKVLVACQSTAQITPKVIFDKEPSLIFTYRFSTACTNEEKNGLDEIANNLKQSYRDKNRIMIPQDEEEFKRYLKNLID